MATNDVWIIAVKTNTVDIPNGTTVVQTLNSGTVVKEASRQDDPTTGWWIQCQSPQAGWFMGIRHTEKEIEAYLAAKAEADAAVADAATEVALEPDPEMVIDLDKMNSSATASILDTTTITYNLADSDFIDIKHVAGVFGLPYQFLPTADPRIVTTNDDNEAVKSSHLLGYEYSNKIIERIPLLFLAPGRPAFLTKYNKAERQTLIGSLIEQGVMGGIAANSSDLDKLLEQGGRYYTFEYKNSEYYTFVNPLCRATAIYLGIQNVKLPGANTTLNKLNWEDFTSAGIKSITDLGNFSSVPFYVDAESSISENWSNSTQASQLASTINNISDMAKEVNFLIGMGSTALNLDSIVDADMTTNMESLDALTSKLAGSNASNFLSNLTGHLTTLAAGGRMYFPEIWADSQLSRSYNCHFKFMSPDPSPLSIYLNVLVPLIHLMCLVAPQTISGNVNSYSTPFLVRAIYKGMFNVDTGIITSMSVNKGGDCQWTKNGIPTSIEVDIEIKDLYNVMAITPTDGNLICSYDTLNNTALMDYVANLCGINIFKPEIRRTIEMWYTINLQNKLGDYIQNNIWGNIQDKVQNLIMGIYR